MKEIRTVTMNYVALSDALTEATEAHKKEAAALRSLYNQFNFGAELTEVRLAYLRSHFDELTTLLNIVLDYQKETGEVLENLSNFVESQGEIGA